MTTRFSGPERTVSLARAFLRELANTHGQHTPPPIEPRLTGSSGATAGKRHVLAYPGASALLGRDPACDIVLLDAEVSREHARIERRGERVTITDLGAKNTTRIDGAAIAPNRPHVLQHGALIEIGGSRFVFEDPVQQYLDSLHPRVPPRAPERASFDPAARPTRPTRATRAPRASILPRVVAAAIAAGALLGLLALWT